MIDMHDDDTPELATAIRDLIHSPGWQWFTDHVTREYGPAAYGMKINAAYAQIPAGPDHPYEVARITQQIHAECAAVNALVERPKEELARLVKKPTERLYDRFRRTAETHR